MQSEVGQRHGRGWILRTVCSVLAALVVAIAPFWVATLRTDFDPPGRACGFSHDPGSGFSASGVEEIEWSLTPRRVCRPIGPTNMLEYGPEFEAAVRGDLPVDPALLAVADHVLRANSTTPLYIRVWPAAWVVLSVLFLAYLGHRDHVRRAVEADERLIKEFRR